MPCQRGACCGHEVVGDVAAGSPHHLRLPQLCLIIFASRSNTSKEAVHVGADFHVHYAKVILSECQANMYLNENLFWFIQLRRDKMKMATETGPGNAQRALPQGRTTATNQASPSSPLAVSITGGTNAAHGVSQHANKLKCHRHNSKLHEEPLYTV